MSLQFISFFLYINLFVIPVANADVDGGISSDFVDETSLRAVEGSSTSPTVQENNSNGLATLDSDDHTRQQLLQAVEENHTNSSNRVTVQVSAEGDVSLYDEVAEQQEEGEVSEGAQELVEEQNYRVDPSSSIENDLVDFDKEPFAGSGEKQLDSDANKFTGNSKHFNATKLVTDHALNESDESVDPVHIVTKHFEKMDFRVVETNKSHDKVLDANIVSGFVHSETGRKCGSQKYRAPYGIVVGVFLIFLFLSKISGALWYRNWEFF